MKTINRFKALSFFLVTAYLLAACGGTLPQSTTSAKGPKVEANVSTDGAVVALKVESSANDDAVMFQVLKRAVMKVGVVAATMVSTTQVE